MKRQIDLIDIRSECKTGIKKAYIHKDIDGVRRIYLMDAETGEKVVIGEVEGEKK